MAAPERMVVRARGVVWAVVILTTVLVVPQPARAGHDPPILTVDRSLVAPGATVTFTLQAETGKPSWVLDFGDGTNLTGTKRNPPPVEHVYATSGVYAVSFAVTKSGHTTWDNLTVTVDAAPQASFAATVDGLTVAGDASASSDPEGAPLTYAWNWGDGAASSGRVVSHAYSSAAVRTITLTVTDPRGLASTASQTVSVNRPPTAAFQVGAAGRTVSLDAASSSDPDGHAVTYWWDLGDAATASGRRVDHTYEYSGHYDLVLTVRDSMGGTATATQRVLANHAPTLQLGAPTGPVRAGTPTRLSVAPADADGDPVSWSLDVQDDGRADRTGVGAADVDVVYTSPGTFVVRLTASDAWSLAAPATGTIEVVADTAPVATLAADATEGTAPFSPTLTPGVTDDGRIANWTFEAGAGGALLRGTGPPPVLRPTYEAAGTYTAILAVWDDAGQRAAASRTVTVAAPAGGNVAPQAWLNLTLPSERVAPRSVTARIAAQDANGDGLTWTLDWGDGTPPASGSGGAATLQHTYASAGMFVPRLTVTDGPGAARVVLGQVEVLAPWVPAVSANPTLGEAPRDVVLTLSAASGAGATSILLRTGLVDIPLAALPYTTTVRYPAAGTYLVTLEMRDGAGRVETATTTLRLNDRPTVTLVATPESGAAPLAASFAWSIVDGDAVTWALDLGDGTSRNGTEKVGRLTHSYPAGTYRPHLEVTDALGSRVTARAVVTVVAPPHATLYAEAEEVPSDRTIRLPEPGEATLAWSVDDAAANWSLVLAGRTLTAGSGLGGAVNHHFPAAGTFLGELTVSGRNGAALRIPFAIVVNARPVVEFSTRAESGEAPFQAAFRLAVVDEAPVNWTLDFGDGTGETGATPHANFTHVYPLGNWTARLTVEDAEGIRVERVVALAVTAPVPRSGDGLARVLQAPSGGRLEAWVSDPDVSVREVSFGGSELANITILSLDHPRTDRYIDFFEVQVRSQNGSYLAARDPTIRFSVPLSLAERGAIFLSRDDGRWSHVLVEPDGADPRQAHFLARLNGTFEGPLTFRVEQVGLAGQETLAVRPRVLGLTAEAAAGLVLLAGILLSAGGTAAWLGRRAIADRVVRWSRRVLRPEAHAEPPLPVESQLCEMCLGAFKGIADLHLCTCGVKMHQSCHARVGTCPACGKTEVAP